MDITKNPLTIGLLRAIGIMVITKDLSNLVHQFDLGIWAELGFICDVFHDLFHVLSFNIAISGK